MDDGCDLPRDPNILAVWTSDDASCTTWVAKTVRMPDPRVVASA